MTESDYQPFTILPLSAGHEVPYKLLELADPSRTQIDSYLKAGTCYIATKDSEVVGVLVLTEADTNSLEIKNIAIKVTCQGKGLGKRLLRHAERMGCEAGYARLLIGTGNSSIGQLALYQKEGFEIKRIDHSFFTKNYPAPIYENGIQCKHMIYLEKKLTPAEKP